MSLIKLPPPVGPWAVDLPAIPLKPGMTIKIAKNKSGILIRICSWILTPFYLFDLPETNGSALLFATSSIVPGFLEFEIRDLIP
jgi:hypothetical protein